MHTRGIHEKWNQRDGKVTKQVVHRVLEKETEERKYK